MEKTNACVKNNELAAILDTHFEGKLNLARVKLIAHFVCALCKVRSVCFAKLANALDHTASADSSLRRIQRFIASFAMDGDLVARLVFALLPEREGLVLTIDRTGLPTTGCPGPLCTRTCSGNWRCNEGKISERAMGNVRPKMKIRGPCT